MSLEITPNTLDQGCHWPHIACARFLFVNHNFYFSNNSSSSIFYVHKKKLQCYISLLKMRDIFIVATFVAVYSFIWFGGTFLWQNWNMVCYWGTWCRSELLLYVENRGAHLVIPLCFSAWRHRLPFCHTLGYDIMAGTLFLPLHWIWFLQMQSVFKLHVRPEFDDVPTNSLQKYFVCNSKLSLCKKCCIHRLMHHCVFLINACSKEISIYLSKYVVCNLFK